MICELTIFASLFAFCQGQHMWRQRPLNRDPGGVFGTIYPNARHDHGFYGDGTNSGYLGKKKGVSSERHKDLKKYDRYPPQNGEMCRHDGLMRQAEQNIKPNFRKDNYVAFSNRIQGEHHNCHDYKKAVNEEYDRLHKENGNKFEKHK